MDSNLTSIPAVGLRSPNLTETTVNLQASFELGEGDTAWILMCSFLIFTMQTGFGMLESGFVSIKNEANIMMKNIADITLGGLSYWLFGYGLSYGEGIYSNPFIGVGNFVVDPPVGDALMGPVLTSFLFQLSFATTATTIVSGAMAERCNFRAYCLFALLNSVVYCVPAGWVWASHGFLNKLGVVDIAGSGPVHLVGGSAALASAFMLGPRLGRYANGIAPLPMGNPANALLGTFVLWWGWMAFNSGSTYGMSGDRWQYAARAAVMTMMGSFGGGAFGLLFTLTKNKGKADVMELMNSVLGSLVSITAGCFLYRSWEALVIGFIGGAIVSGSAPLIDMMGIDDPVGASAVHGACGLWGVLAVGLFADNPIPLETTSGRAGLFKGGGWYLLGVQSLTCVCLMAWGFFITMILLWIIDKVVPIRLDPYMELLGADISQHRIRHGRVGVTRPVTALRPFHKSAGLEEIDTSVNGSPGLVGTMHETKRKKGVFQMFTNKAFLNDQNQPSASDNDGITNNTGHRQTMPYDSMVHELNSRNGNSPGLTKPQGIPEGLKGRKYKDLTRQEIKELGEINMASDRFRHRYHEEDYINDIDRCLATNVRFPQ